MRSPLASSDDQSELLAIITSSGVAGAHDGSAPFARNFASRKLGIELAAMSGTHAFGVECPQAGCMNGIARVP